MSYAYSLSQKCTGAQQLAPWPSLNLDFANGDYLTSAGFADQASVGSANFNLGVSTGATPVFTRASGATYRYSDGCLRYAPENLLTRSQEFDNVAWTKYRILAFGSGSVANATVSPDGTQSADLIVESTDAGFHDVERNSSNSELTSTISVFAKAQERRYVVVCNGGALATLWVSATFDLDPNGNGTVTLTGAGSSSTYVSSKIEYVGDGWYRCSVTGTHTLAATVARIAISDTSTRAYGNYGIPSYAGNGTSGLYIWGAQLERHSSTRPYISTTSAAVYGPRFEYAADGTPLGLLIEESSTNLLTYSEQFDSSAWAKSLTVTGNDAVSPFGLTTADKITGAGRLYQTVTVTAGTTYTASVWVKNSTCTTFYYDIFNTSAVSSITTGNWHSLISTSEWRRMAITFTTPAGCTSIRFYIGSANLVSLGAGEVAYIWGAQLEQKPFATSYIPTVASTVARSADVCDISGASFTGFFPAGNFSVVSAGDRIANVANSGFYDFYSLADSFTALNHGLSVGGNEVITIGVSTNEAISLGAASPVNVSTKIAVSHDQVNLAGSRDGGAVTTVAAEGGFPYTPDRVYIGYRKDDNKYLNGHISLLKVYDRSLQSKLQSLSA